MTATIASAAVQELGLSISSNAYAIIKAADVMIEKGSLVLSARNALPGTVVSVERGAVNGTVTLDADNARLVVATISLAAVDELGLREGVPATAIIKAPLS